MKMKQADEEWKIFAVKSFTTGTCTETTALVARVTTWLVFHLNFLNALCTKVACQKKKKNYVDYYD